MSKIYNILPSIFFNFRYLPIKYAIKFPFMVGWNLKIKNISKGQILINKPLKRFSIQIACDTESPGLQYNKRTMLLGSKNCIIKFNGDAIISNGSTIRCDKNSTIEFGNKFYCNNNCYIRSNSNIIFGNNCLLGWNVTINSTDGHTILYKDEEKVSTKPIYIGNRVWIAAYCSLGKGVILNDDIVVAYGSVVINEFKENNILIGGVPAKIKSHDISWKY